MAASLGYGSHQSTNQRQTRRECLKRGQDTLMKILKKHSDHSQYVCIICIYYQRSFSKRTKLFSGHWRINLYENLVNPLKPEPSFFAPPERFNKVCLDNNFKYSPPRSGMQPYRNHIQTIGSCILVSDYTEKILLVFTMKLYTNFREFFLTTPGYMLVQGINS